MLIPIFHLIMSRYFLFPLWDGQNLKLKNSYCGFNCSVPWEERQSVPDSPNINLQSVLRSPSKPGNKRDPRCIYLPGSEPIWPPKRHFFFFPPENEMLIYSQRPSTYLVRRLITVHIRTREMTSLLWCRITHKKYKFSLKIPFKRGDVATFSEGYKRICQTLVWLQPCRKTAAPVPEPVQLQAVCLLCVHPQTAVLLLWY